MKQQMMVCSGICFWFTFDLTLGLHTDWRVPNLWAIPRYSNGVKDFSSKSKVYLLEDIHNKQFDAFCSFLLFLKSPRENQEKVDELLSL